VRCLSVPWIGKQATPQLIEEFQNAPLDSSLAWAIGNALSIVDVKGFEKEILCLCRNPKYGTARQMLVFEELLTDKRAVVRKEARKAITRIMK
jgi:hypothetical protein